jgi:uncharacterized protein (TIGR03435 family)
MAFATTTAIAQTSPTPDAAPPSAKNAPAAKPTAFDVVSIRPSKPSSFGGGFHWETSPDGYQVTGQSMWYTIMIAYFPQGYSYWSDDRLLGAPLWVTKDLYDINAKVTPNDIAEWQKQGIDLNHKEMLRAMLRTMLADRCKLVVHRIPGEIPSYALVVGRHGPKLKEWKPDEPIPSSGMAFPDGGRAVFDHGGQTIHFYKVSMESFAWYISMFKNPGWPVQDKTGLTGMYDFVLQSQNMGSPPSGQEDLSASDPGPSIHEDLDALGLTLKPSKAPAESLVIDHIERPSEN